MTREQVVLARVAGFGIWKVNIEDDERDGYPGVRIDVYKIDNDDPLDFFIPDYAQMRDGDMGEVVANNLREELWNSSTS